MIDLALEEALKSLAHLRLGLSGRARRCGGGQCLHRGGIAVKQVLQLGRQRILHRGGQTLAVQLGRLPVVKGKTGGLRQRVLRAQDAVARVTTLEIIILRVRAVVRHIRQLCVIHHRGKRGRQQLLTGHRLHAGSQAQRQQHHYGY